MANFSSKLPAVEIIEDARPMSGRFNMGMDAAMLQLGATRETSVIRIYRWESPTVTLGYFQASSGSLENPFPQLACVRRLSGGGAILHDQEITYSCVLPASHPIRQDPSRLYEVVHGELIRLLQDCGVPCCLRSEFDAGRSLSEKPAATHHSESESLTESFLCFLRSNPNDIVHASGTKIVGSAQRRRKGITLQHGSILLSASTLAPELPGIHQMCESFNESTLTGGLGVTIAKSIGDQWGFRTYASEEIELSQEPGTPVFQ